MGVKEFEMTIIMNAMYLQEAVEPSREIIRRQGCEVSHTEQVACCGVASRARTIKLTHGNKCMSLETCTHMHVNSFMLFSSLTYCVLEVIQVLRNFVFSENWTSHVIPTPPNTKNHWTGHLRTLHTPIALHKLTLE